MPPPEFLREVEEDDPIYSFSLSRKNLDLAGDVVNNIIRSIVLLFALLYFLVLVLVLFLKLQVLFLNNAPPEKVVFRNPVSTSQKCETKIRRNQINQTYLWDSKVEVK